MTSKFLDAASIAAMPPVPPRADGKSRRVPARYVDQLCRIIQNLQSVQAYIAHFDVLSSKKLAEAQSLLSQALGAVDQERNRTRDGRA
jgi:hypothetical protein